MTDNDYLLAIGDNIKRIRKDRSLTQSDLAYKCDMEKSNIIRIEKGRTNPTSLVLRRIAKVLKVSVQEFFEGL